MTEQPDDEILTEAEAANFLGFEKSDFADWRERGEAPPHTFDDDGAPVYQRSELVDWRDRMVVPPPWSDDGENGAG